MRSAGQNEMNALGESTDGNQSVGIISDALLSIDGFNQSAYTLFLNSIPYSFYPFLLHRH